MREVEMKEKTNSSVDIIHGNFSRSNNRASLSLCRLCSSSRSECSDSSSDAFSSGLDNEEL